MNNQYIKSMGQSEEAPDMNPQERLVTAKETGKDGWQQSLRPQTLDEYIGQSEFKENLKVYIEAAKMRKEALDHVLLSGPPGLGKTTMASIIANEMGVNFRVTSGPAISRPGDLASLLSNLEEHDVLFIDEIHRLSRSVEEVLYPAMEDFALDIVMGKGPGARTIRIDLPPFTLIGATTRTGGLAKPFLDRFGIRTTMRFYNPEELEQIVLRAATILEVPIEEEGAREIAKRSRGTPRIANRMLKRVRDFAQVKGNGTITAETAQCALRAEHVDEIGLDATDIRILRAVIERFNGGPVGIDAIAATISEERTTVEDMYEPYLIQIGFISRTSRGRIACKAAYTHLGISWESMKTDSLFEGE